MSESEDAAMKSDDEFPTDRPNWDLPRDLGAIEAQLAALAPRDDRLDRERLMFLAGQASVAPANQQHGRLGFNSPRNVRMWQAAFAGMTVVATSLLALLVTRPAIVGPPTARDRDVATSTRLPAPMLTGSGHRGSI